MRAVAFLARLDLPAIVRGRPLTGNAAGGRRLSVRDTWFARGGSPSAGSHSLHSRFNLAED